MSWDVAVVADDLTGANDTTVQFARGGWPTLVALTPMADRVFDGCSAGVLAVTTDSRAAGDLVAEERTADTVRMVMATGVRSLYLKIDSTMRGSVPGQIRGAVKAWAARHPGAFAVLCPAYPAMGRTVCEGKVLLNGRPLEDGAPGRDPVTPVRTSVMTGLVPGAVHVPMPRQGGAQTLADAVAAAVSQTAVVSVDAMSDEDLDVVADAIAALGPWAIPVGSAGLASALATRWRQGDVSALVEPHRMVLPGPPVVLVTSLNQTARIQERRLMEEHAGRLLALAPGLEVLLDADRFTSWCADHDDIRSCGADVVLVSAPDQASPEGSGAADVIAQRLADLVARLHARNSFAGVVVTGGDGARALADRWRCAGIAVFNALSEGMPHGVLVGGDADGLPIVTKAGGFGGSDALLRAVRHAAGDASPGHAGRQPTHR